MYSSKQQSGGNLRNKNRKRLCSSRTTVLSAVRSIYVTFISYAGTYKRHGYRPWPHKTKIFVFDETNIYSVPVLHALFVIITLICTFAIFLFLMSSYYETHSNLLEFTTEDVCMHLFCIIHLLVFGSMYTYHTFKTCFVTLILKLHKLFKIIGKHLLNTSANILKLVL